ncbi:MAG TPA: phosphoethanolamine--lipid A transferase [Candidatus Desulfobacillus sp.]|nr:phosphoethanolamine--lipid A transferase [Candidatus Desulfobacillus sp.]
MALSRRPGRSGNALLLTVCLFIVACGNLSFFSRLQQAFPTSGGSLPELLSLAAAFLALNVLLLGALAFGKLTRPVLAAALLIAAPAAYFMDSYGTVIDKDMLRNVLQTNPAEVLDLVTARLLAYVILLGVLPAFLVWRTRLAWRGWRRELASRAGLLLLSLLAIAALTVVSGSFYASFLRGHKSLRGYANPLYPLYSAAGLMRGAQASERGARPATIAPDASITRADGRRRLVLLVIGEAARADRFALNGYARDTTPRLREAGAISLDNVSACGTSTAISVPCMFSARGMARFEPQAAGSEENLLDVLQRAGVNVLWLDNNSDSKGAAARVPYRSFKAADVNTICDSECRDEGMLVPLQEYIDAHPRDDIVIVLHQMGNHGPAYYKRYPASFEKFRPACRSDDLGRCSREEIGNAYDNALLYTDHFLGEAIALLGRNDARFATALFYLSDHGESLGEGGLFLHGLPRAVAPQAQLRVPAIFWFGSGFPVIDRDALLLDRDRPFSHDNFFHTVLGLLDVRTAWYRPELDILAGSRGDPKQHP